MFRSASLTAFFVLAASVAASSVVCKPPVTLRIARQLNKDGVRNVLEKDQNRAKLLLSVGKSKESGILSPKTAAATNLGDAGIYVANVGIGSPPTNYSLVVDTGSSNTWVGAGKAYVKTITSMQTGDHVNVSYGSGEFSGAEYLDTVTIAPGLVIHEQSIGVASSSVGFDFDSIDGILGIGPTDLTLGTLIPDENCSIPTVTDNLYDQGKIGSKLVAISFEPATSPSDKNGELMFGGIDPAKYIGSITTIPRTKARHAKYYWGIDQSIRYGKHTILQTTGGIVDTGCTLILIATDAFDRYKSATGSVIDNGTGLLRITKNQYHNLKPLVFRTGGTSFSLNANAQIWPRELNTYIGGTPSHIYLIVADIGSPSGQGLDFVNGYSFLERHYAVFDSATGKVGLAATPYTTATTN